MDKEKLFHALGNFIAINLKIVEEDTGTDNDHQFYSGKLSAYRELLDFINAQKD